MPTAADAVDTTAFVSRFRWDVPGGGGVAVVVGDYGAHGLVVQDAAGGAGAWPEHENLARTFGPHVRWYAGGCLAGTPRTRFSTEELCGILLGICEGLRVLHQEHGVSHGHVVPAVMYVDRRTNGPPTGVLHPPPLGPPASVPDDLRALVHSATTILGEEEARSLWDRLRTTHAYDAVLGVLPNPCVRLPR
jgi:hypothetical protein